MGNEASKPLGAAEAADTARSRSRESTPPIGTGRYADHGNLKEEALELDAGPASSLEVQGLGGTQRRPTIHEALPAQPTSRYQFSSRPPPASDPEFRDGLPTLSSPNRVRPPSPPPATEPLPPQMSPGPDQFPPAALLPTLKKTKKSKKSRSSIASTDDYSSLASANLESADTSGEAESAPSTPSDLTKAARKALRRARKEAEKAARAAGDTSGVMVDKHSSALSVEPITPGLHTSDMDFQSMPPPPPPSAVPSTPTPAQTSGDLYEPPTVNGLGSSSNGEHGVEPLLPADDITLATLLSQETREVEPSRKRKAPESSGKESRKKKSKGAKVTDFSGDDAQFASTQPVEADSEMADAQPEHLMLAFAEPQQETHQDLSFQQSTNRLISELSNGAIQAMVAGSHGDADLALDPSLAALDSYNYAEQNGQDLAEALTTGTSAVPQRQRATRATYRDRKLATGSGAMSGDDNLEQQQEPAGSGEGNSEYPQEVAMTQTGEQTPQRPADVAGDQVAPGGSQQPGTQSTGRRKSKISYLDRQAVQVANTLAELPGDEAASPAVRKRAEKASKRKPRIKADPEEGSSKKKEKVQANWAKGALSAEENAKIQDAVEEFRSEEQMSQFEVNELIHEDPSRKGTEKHKLFWEKVHSALPRRPPRIINYRTRKLFHNFIGRQVFSKEEDDELRRLVELKGPRWSEIGALINRSPLDIRDRWRNYTVCGDKKKADFWSQEEEERLVERAIEAIDNIKQSRIQSNKDNSDEAAERDISWELISQAMDRTRSAKQCREKWFLLRERQRVSVDGTLQNGDDRISEVLDKTRVDLRKMTPEDKLRLIEAVRKTDVELDDNIVWSKLGNSKFRKQWNRNTLRIMWARLRQTVQDQESMSTRAVADALVELYKKDNVLVELGDSDVDNEVEVSLLDVGPSARKTYRTPRVGAPKNQFEALKLGSAASANNTPTKKKRKTKATETETAPGDAVQEHVFPEQSNVSVAKQTRGSRSKDRVQSNGRRESDINKPETPGKYKSAQFVDDNDDSDDDRQRSTSPEVPASPDMSQIQSTGDFLNGQVGSQVVATDSQEFATDEDLMETESIDLAQPDRSKSASRAGSSIVDEDGHAGADGQYDTAPPRGTSVQSDNSSVFAAKKFKKRKSAAAASTRATRSAITPRTPYSAGHKKSNLSVYDDIESAHGESSQMVADEVDDTGMMDTQDEEAHQRQMALVDPSLHPMEPEDDEGEDERRRLAQLSDDDSDMEDIPAELPRLAADGQ